MERRCCGLAFGLLLLSLTGSAAAGPQPETVGRVLSLPSQPGPHWFWMSDALLHRTALFDADSGELLGTISSGTAGVGFAIVPQLSHDHREIYLAESYYSRGVRGERSDVVTVYDAVHLNPIEEIAIPPKRAEYFPGTASSALSDDGRFMAVFNVTPATSVSLVDVQERRFVTEVPTPGCSLVYPAGPRRFLMLCANGGALTVTVGDDGAGARVERIEPFFNPVKDPLTEKAVRHGSQWLFVSFEGVIQPIDVSGATPGIGTSWPLFDDAARAEHWRIGGQQHLAVHAASNRLYVLVHQGEPDTHKESGSEVWVYDIKTHARLARIPTRNPLINFVDEQSGLASKGRSGRAILWLLEKALPNPGIERILVTQDDHPVLIAATSLPPAITVHDALTGEPIGTVTEPGLAGTVLIAP